MLSRLLHCIWVANSPPPPHAADLAAPSPITILTPFPGIQAAAGERIVHCPEAAAGLDLRLAQVKGRKEEQGGAYSTCIDMQQTTVLEQRPLSMY